MVEQYVGGTGFGAEFLYREVPPGVQWDDPENRIIMASGPLGGTTVSGAGAFALVTKGPMTNLAITSQAIGFWGAFLKFCGYDAVIIQGQAPRWVYLHIDDGRVVAARRFAHPGQGHLGDGGCHPAGPRGDAADERLRHRAGGRSQGPLRGRRRRQGPCLFEERLRGGHGGQNGSRPLRWSAADKPFPSTTRNFSARRPTPSSSMPRCTGRRCTTAEREANFSTHYKAGSLPVRNFTTNIFPEHEGMNGQYLPDPFRAPQQTLLGLQDPPYEIHEGHRRPLQGAGGRGAGIRMHGGLGTGDRQYGPRGGGDALRPDRPAGAGCE